MKFKIPFLHNVRLGHATNSSSSHSLVYFDTPRPDHDTDPSDVDSTEFGWDLFKLRTKRQKLTYALTAIFAREGLNYGWTEDDAEAQTVIKKYVDQYPTLESMVMLASRGYIDHQSVVGDPEKLIKAALDPKVEIWGGNDNGGDPHEDYMTWRSGIDKDRAPAGLVDVEYLGD